MKQSSASSMISVFHGRCNYIGPGNILRQNEYPLIARTAQADVSFRIHGSAPSAEHSLAGSKPRIPQGSG